MSRLFWLLGLLLAQGNAGELRSHLRYQRTVMTHGAGQTCAVLDPLMFAHASETLSDLRLLHVNGAEVPYVITVSGTAATEPVTVPVRNLVQRGGVLSFDLVMPNRPYTDVVLDLGATDFIANAVVSSRQGTPAVTTQLGQFAIFDLSAQHLPRSAVLHLQETTLPNLHVELRPAPGSHVLQPGMVRGATVPPSREAQTLYTTAVRSGELEQRGQETVAQLTVPQRVPIERVLIALASTFHGDFNRAVRIEAHALGAPATGVGNEAETLTGVIARVHLTREGLAIDADRMAVPATLGANLQTAAAVEVAIENGASSPLPVRSVALQTRERRVCFDVLRAAEPLTLLYGDPQLRAPNQVATLDANLSSQVATIGPEQLNPAYAGRAGGHSLRSRHPRLLSLGFLLVICLLGVAALRSAKLRL